MVCPRNAPRRASKLRFSIVTHTHVYTRTLQQMHAYAHSLTHTHTNTLTHSLIHPPTHPHSRRQNQAWLDCCCCCFHDIAGHAMIHSWSANQDLTTVRLCLDQVHHWFQVVVRGIFQRNIASNEVLLIVRHIFLD